VQQHTPGSTIEPVIVSVQPGQLGKPEISENLYECGVTVPVSKLFPGVLMHTEILFLYFPAMSIMSLIFLFIIALLLGFMCLLIVRVYFYVGVVSGNSMYPAFKEGERVIVIRYWPKRWLRKGQVVIAEDLPIMSGELTKFASYTFTELEDGSHKPIIFTPSLIKRLIGLPEETVVVSGTQPILRTQSLPPLNDTGNYIWHIPPNHCFLKGDSVGIDSCVWGPIPINHIRGVVAFKLTKDSWKVTPDRLPG
jgi:signal peptidase I